MGPKKHPLQTERDQALDAGAKQCACGTSISPRALRCERCRCRLAQARYKKTAKGKAAEARYGATPNRRRTRAVLNAHRIFVAGNYHGLAPSIERATAIRQYAKERIRAFKGFETRAEAKGVSAGAVSTEAAV